MKHKKYFMKMGYLFPNKYILNTNASLSKYKQCLDALSKEPTLMRKVYLNSLKD